MKGSGRSGLRRLADRLVDAVGYWLPLDPWWFDGWSGRSWAPVVRDDQRVPPAPSNVRPLLPQPTPTVGGRRLPPFRGVELHLWLDGDYARIDIEELHSDGLGAHSECSRADAAWTLRRLADKIAPPSAEPPVSR